ncbi:MAG: hypothetical protein NT166_32600 [Candidatus Aminicenantes bacterium]|nr:hypothetical protein [Candidatus Aminicenantes bacterium]
MYVSPKRIITLIGDSSVGFTNAKDNEIILNQIIEKGYNSTKMDDLLGLNTLADQKFHAFEVKHGERIQATLDLEAKLTEEMNNYANDRKLAFHIFGSEQDIAIRNQLGIDMPLKQNFNGFLEQSQQFYDTILKKKEILARLDEFAMTAEKIQERLNGLSALRILNDIQETKKGFAAIALTERAESYDQLRIAWGKFKTVCLITFEKSQEHLKMLNIRPPAVRTKKTAEPEPPTPPIPPVPPAPPVPPVPPAPPTA